MLILLTYLSHFIYINIRQKNRNRLIFNLFQFRLNLSKSHQVDLQGVNYHFAENSIKMTPKQVVEQFVSRFNKADADALAELYAPDAINHQVAHDPVIGRENIHKMFTAEFANADMTCIVENIFEDGEWGILEWKDPLGLRGCGFFHVINGKIKLQRGYWDKLSFLRMHKLPIPKE